MNKEKIYQYAILSLFVLVIVFNHIFGYLGHYGWDDMHYAEMANDVLQGTIHYDDHYFYRWPTVLLTALSYKIFGINDFASSLPAMGISIGILLLVFSILKRYSLFVLFIGLSLLTLANWFLFYTDKLMPDIFVAFFILSAVITIYRYKFIEKETQPLKYASLLAISLLFGFLAKETIALFLPVLAYLFVVDVFITKKRTFWIYATGITFSLFVLYFLLLYAITGDAFIRFKTILDNRYFSECSYHELPIIYVIKRVAYQFYEMFIGSGMFLSIVLLLPVFITKKHLPDQQAVKEVWSMSNELSFFSVVGLILVLSSNFMSISYTEYIPMCIDPRHYLFIFPITSIAAAFVIDKYLNKIINIRVIIILIGLLTLLSLLIVEQLFWPHYFPLCVLFFAAGFMSFQTNKMKIIFAILFFAILSIVPVQNIIAYRNTEYHTQKQAIIEHIIGKQENCIVISNQVQTRENKYYCGFKTINNIQFLSFDEITEDMLNSSIKKILILNNYTLYLSNKTSSNMPYYATMVEPDNFKTIYKNEKLKFSILELTKVAYKIIETTNDFETEIPFWNYPKEQLVNTNFKSGATAHKIDEYSSTFQLYLDSISVDVASNLKIKTEVYQLFKDSTEAQIVVSIESNNEVYYWKSAGLTSPIAAGTIDDESEWKNVDMEFSVNKGELKSNSLLKIYVWNPKKQECLIDDFKITLFGFR